MPERQRAPSARSTGGSRRRRWEVKSREAFETALAVEIDSPQGRPRQYKRGEPRKGSSTESAESRTNSRGNYRQNKERSPRLQPPDGPPDYHRQDSDPLSARLSALIDEVEASGKNQDAQPRFSADKSPPQYGEIYDTIKDHGVKLLEGPPAQEGFVSHDTKTTRETEKTKVLNDKFETKSLKVAESPVQKQVEEEAGQQGCHQPSAPPLSPSHPQLPEKKKKKNKKKESKLVLMSSSNEESYISLQLKELGDDVVEISRDDNSCILSAPKLLFAATGNPPGTISTIYQEKLGGFVVTSNKGLEGIPKRSEDLLDPTQVATRASHAIFLQSGFRTFSVLVQGLLAGITLTHCLLIFLVSEEAEELPVVYNPVMAQVFFTLIVCLCSLCLVAAADRCDLVGAGVVSAHGIRVPWTAAFYISSLVLTLVSVRAESVLIHPTLHPSSMMSQDQMTDLVDWWRWMCLARTCLCVLAWLAVVPDPHTDALLDSLHLQQ